MHRIERAFCVVTWVLAAGCGSTPPPVPPDPGSGPEPEPVAPAAPGEPAASEEPAAATRLRELVSQSLPGATVGDVVPAAGGGTASVTFRSVRLRIAYTESATGLRIASGDAISSEHLLEAVLFLAELSEAGAVLSRSGRSIVTEADGELDCPFDQGEPFCRPDLSIEQPPAVSLDPAPWTLPPPRRPRARPASPPVTHRAPAPASPAAARIAEVLGRHPLLRLGGTALDAGAGQLLVVTDETDGPPAGVLLCIASAEHGAPPAVDCTTSAIDELEGVVSALPSGWLVVAGSTFGNQRSGSRLLAAVTRTTGGPVVDTVDLGGAGGDGEACEDGNGYCVFMEGVGHRARLVSPTCVEITPGDTWSAVHHRVGDRWTNVRIEPASGVPERHDVSSGRFVRGTCEAAGAVRDRE